MKRFLGAGPPLPNRPEAKAMSYASGNCGKRYWAKRLPVAGADVGVVNGGEGHRHRRSVLSGSTPVAWAGSWHAGLRLPG